MEEESAQRKKETSEATEGEEILKRGGVARSGRIGGLGERGDSQRKRPAQAKERR